jgi:CBS domain containing-hemolysin-like protein
MNDPSDSRRPRNGGASQISNHKAGNHRGGLLDRLRGLLRPRNGEASVRETFEELIEEREEIEAPIDAEERALLFNILRLSERTVYDVMVPRADIVAVERGESLDNLISIMTSEGHSRLPVYRDTLDDVLGMVHIKDVLAAQRAGGEQVPLDRIVRRVLYVPASMRVLELLLEMRTTRVHMALVVDEFGGTDGLVTIEDLVEEIVGEIEDEHDHDVEPTMVARPDGAYDADARVTIEMFEESAGPVISEDEREDVDTLGGLVFSLAGRVPVRGELIEHPSGYVFEVIDADPRRIRRLRIHPPKTVADAVSRRTA